MNTELIVKVQGQIQLSEKKTTTMLKSLKELLTLRVFGLLDTLDVDFFQFCFTLFAPMLVSPESWQ